jgi:hypothetical protein
MSKHPRGFARLIVGVPAVLTALVLLAACGTSGRAMRAPAPGATSPPRVNTGATTTLAGAGIVANTLAPTNVFTIGSPTFLSGQAMPAAYSCDGTGASPALDWATIPQGTAELVISIVDPDAKGFVHWLVAGIPPTTTRLAEGQVLPGVVQLANGSALSSPSGLTAASDTQAALTKVASTANGVALLTGTFTRPSATTTTR